MTQKHTSYSAIGAFLNCGEQYRLQKIMHVPEVPAWWSWGGTAFHAITEAWDYLDYMDLADEFDNTPERAAAALEKAQRERKAAEGYEPRSSKGQGEAWWLENIPVMVDRYIEWRRTSGWQLVTVPREPGSPDWIPGIELKVLAEFGGLPMLGYVDRVFKTPANEIVVVDLKTSQRKPSNTLQLGTYAVLLEETYGLRPDLGAYFMGRTGVLTDPIPLDNYTPEYLDRYVAPFKIARDTGAYVANPAGTLCGVCGVAYACWAKGGKDASLYAPNATEHNETENPA